MCIFGFEGIEEYAIYLKEFLNLVFHFSSNEMLIKMLNSNPYTRNISLINFGFGSYYTKESFYKLKHYKIMSVRCQYEDSNEIGAHVLLTNKYCILGVRKQPEHDSFH